MLGDADGRSDLGQFVEVSVPGLFLIAEVHKASNVPLPVMSIRIHGNGGRRWLNELAGYAEGVPLRIGNLMLSDISVRTPVEGQALVGLLQHCQHWLVDQLGLSGTVDGRFWQGLASAMPVEPVLPDGTKGKIRCLKVSAKVLVRGGSDQVKKVWQFTGNNCQRAYWWVFGRTESAKIYRRPYPNGMDRMEEGWKEIEVEIFKEVFVDMGWISLTEIYLISELCQCGQCGQCRSGTEGEHQLGHC